MLANGWQGDPIEAIAHQGNLYIINGHHRVAAAKRTATSVLYRIISSQDLQRYHYNSIDDVILAWIYVPGNRLRR